MKKNEEIILEGFAISKGIAIGIPHFFLEQKSQVTREFSLDVKEVDQEVERYRGALKQSSLDVQLLQKTLRQDGFSLIAEILDTHLAILGDPFMTVDMEEKIRAEKKNSEAVFYGTIEEYKQQFGRVKDSFFRERVKDIVDVSHRVLRHLCQFRKVDLQNVPVNSVLILQEVVPSDIVEAKTSQVGAFVTQTGGYASHAAIIARARGIPYITNIDVFSLKEMKIEQMIVDGLRGKIIMNPTEETLLKYVKEKEFLELDEKNFETEFFNLKVLRKGQDPIKLFGNIDTFQDVKLLQKYKADGIGLFRSEFFFVSEKAFPTEEVQFQIYSQIAAKLDPQPTIIRLFDMRGEKESLFSFWEEEWDEERYHELNPLLGCRGIRFLLKNEKILVEQLKALLRASRHGNIQILIPMISDLSELRQVKRLIEKIRKEFLEQGEPPLPQVPLGCMIEVPSSALMIDFFAKESDFLSIGTNDLAQYVLASDRSNSQMNYLYQGMHPSMLYFLQNIVLSAEKHKKPLSICGELAADPFFTKILLSLGLRNFSLSPKRIPALRRVFQEIKSEQLPILLEKAFQMSTVDELRELLLEDQKN